MKYTGSSPVSVHGAEAGFLMLGMKGASGWPWHRPPSFVSAPVLSALPYEGVCSEMGTSWAR